MSLKYAMQSALALRDYKQSVKEKLMKDNKEWNPDVLIDGGVTYFNYEYLCDKTQKCKSKKVKIVVTLNSQDSSTVIGKGKFVFRNGMGNKVFMSVKSYTEANNIVAELYGKGMYRVSTEMV